MIENHNLNQNPRSMHMTRRSAHAPRTIYSMITVTIWLWGWGAVAIEVCGFSSLVIVHVCMTVSQLHVENQNVNYQIMPHYPALFTFFGTNLKLMPVSDLWWPQKWIIWRNDVERFILRYYLIIWIAVKSLLLLWRVILICWSNVVESYSAGFILHQTVFEL